MYISPLSPTWARWQLQGFQAERRHSSTSVICGDPCHTHTDTNIHIYTHNHSVHIPSTYQGRYGTHTQTHTHTLPPPHVRCCSSLTRAEQANSKAWQTDRPTDVSLSESLHQGGLSDETRAEDHSSQSHDALHKLTSAQSSTHSVDPIYTSSSRLTTCNNELQCALFII